MVGHNRTNELFEFIRIKTKSNQNATTKPKPTNDEDLDDSMIITTGKQMLFNIRKMHEMIEENTSSYLDLNRFLDPSITNTQSPAKSSSTKPKITHHGSSKSKQNKIWDEDNRLKFENQVLMFVKDITAQITNLSKLLGMISYLLLFYLHTTKHHHKFTKQRQLRIGSGSWLYSTSKEYPEMPQIGSNLVK